LRDESLEVAAKVVAHAGRRGMSAAQFATLWVLNNRFVTSVIAGAVFLICARPIRWLAAGVK